MKSTTFAPFALTAALLVVPSLAGAASYELDPAHSTVQFSVRHMMVSNVRGEFREVSGSLEFDEKDLAKSSIDVSINAKSISTANEKRDEHLRNADFLDVEKFPTITFKSKKFVKTGNGHKVTGDLTLHGVTKEVVLNVDGPTKEVKDPWGGIRIGASATAKINRKDFGLTWNKALEAGGVVVGDEISIQLEVEFTKKAAAPKSK